MARPPSPNSSSRSSNNSNNGRTSPINNKFSSTNYRNAATIRTDSSKKDKKNTSMDALYNAVCEDDNNSIGSNELYLDE